MIDPSDLLRLVKSNQFYLFSYWNKFLFFVLLNKIFVLFYVDCPARKAKKEALGHLRAHASGEFGFGEMLHLSLCSPRQLRMNCIACAAVLIRNREHRIKFFKKTPRARAVDGGALGVLLRTGASPTGHAGRPRLLRGWCCCGGRKSVSHVSNPSKSNINEQRIPRCLCAFSDFVKDFFFTFWFHYWRKSINQSIDRSTSCVYEKYNQSVKTILNHCQIELVQSIVIELYSIEK